MPWNWEHHHWPNFTYTPEMLQEYEATFLHKTGIFWGSLKHIAEEEQDMLKVILISDEAYKTPRSREALAS